MVENVIQIKSGITTNVDVSAKIGENIMCAKKIIFEILVHAFFFFLSGFSFMNIHESQDCRGRGRAFL